MFGVGRQFWNCGTGQDCKFFQWADEDAPPQNQGNAWGGSSSSYGANQNNFSGRGRGGGAGGGKRKCSVCHQQG
jgi:hypothetical protein